jgi:hypothetical protein
VPDSDHPARDTYEPYAPPKVDATTQTRRVGSARPLTWAYAVCVGATLSFPLVGMFLRYRGARSATLARVPGQVFGITNVALATAWLYVTWQGIPQRHRWTISPARAAVSLFIPIYGLYWILAVTRALCDALDGILSEGGSDRRAPRLLGILAAITLYANLALGWANSALRSQHTGATTFFQWAVYGSTHVEHALWLAYAFMSDEALGDVAQILATQEPPAAPHPSKVQKTRGPRLLLVVAFWVIAIVGFLACWQILQPGERVRGSPSHSGR